MHDSFNKTILYENLELRKLFINSQEHKLGSSCAALEAQFWSFLSL